MKLFHAIRGSWILPCALLTFFCLFCASSLQAQQAPTFSSGYQDASAQTNLVVSGLSWGSESPEDALWQLGPFRVSPILELGNVSLVPRITTEDGPTLTDLTWNGRGGLRAFLKTGSKLTWTAFGESRYYWWRNQDSKRGFRFGGGVQGEARFNRLRVLGSFSQEKPQQQVSFEFEQPVDVTDRRWAVNTQLQITERISWVAAFQQAQTSYKESELESLNESVTALDQRQRSWRTGIEWSLPVPLVFGLGVHHQQSDFEDPDSVRDRKRTALALSARLDGNKLQGNLNLLLGRERRELSGEQLDGFVTGSFGLQKTFGRQLGASLSGYASTFDSALDTEASYVQRSLAFSLFRPLGHRILVRSLLQVSWFQATGVEEARADVLDSRSSTYGVQGIIRLRENWLMNLTANRQVFESEDDAVDRSGWQVGASLALRIGILQIGGGIGL